MQKTGHSKIEKALGLWNAWLVLALVFLVTVPAWAAILPVIPQAKPHEIDTPATKIQALPAHKPMKSESVFLSEEDAVIYEKIFALQKAGKLRQADLEMEKLHDFRLRGHVLFQRYMHPVAYRSSFEELRNWLDLYADHPEAKRIYRLAQSRMPADFKGRLKSPTSKNGIAVVREPMVYSGKEYRAGKRRTKAQRQEMSKLSAQTYKDIRKNAPTRALRRLNASPANAYMDAAEIDILRSHVARGYLHAGKLNHALDLAGQAATRSGQYVPLAGWVAGMVSWRQGYYDRAAKYFELTGNSEYASGWTLAAGSYWAARAHMKTGNVRAVSKWLRKAADHPRTFYGLIATRALGRNFDFNWKMPKFTRAQMEIIASNKHGVRALALVAAGQRHLAQAELLRINPKNSPKLQQALFSFANHAGLPGLAMRLGNIISRSNDEFYDSALYPIGPWSPANGYKLDPSLLQAIMRQESRFEPLAESRSGAMGLMQLMPTTASYISGNNIYKKRSGQHKLLDPETNMEIGQKYIEKLMNHKNVKGDLFSLFVAYNAGPGNLRKWKRELSNTEDPLLFVESIPVAETRAYVERVASNYWIYRLREGLKTPTLDDVATGKLAQYAGKNNKHSKSHIAKKYPSAKANYRLAYNP